MRDPYRALASDIEAARCGRAWGPSERAPLHLTGAEWDLVIAALHKAAKPYGRRASDARMRALRQIEKRDWPAGEPRLGWLHAGTAKALLRDELIAERPGTDNPARNLTCIVDLTDAGRAAPRHHPQKGERIVADPVPLRERIRDRRTGRTHEILARDAEIGSAAILRQGAKVVVIREMLTARVQVLLVGEIDGGHFEPVDPAEPVERSRLHVVPKEEGR